MVPVATLSLVLLSKISALICFSFNGKMLLSVLTLRSSLAANEKLAGEREKIVSGGAVPLRRGLTELKLKAGTLGRQMPRAMPTLLL